VPAACGIVWVLGAGPHHAAAGFGRGPAATMGVLPRIFTGPAAVARSAGAVCRGPPGELPLARMRGWWAAARRWGVRRVPAGGGVGVVGGWDRNRRMGRAGGPPWPGPHRPPRADRRVAAGGPRAHQGGGLPRRR